MKRILCVILASLPGVARASGADPGVPVALVQKSGDLLQVGLPLAALGLTFLLDDSAARDDAAQWLPGGPAWSEDMALRMTGSPRHDLALAVARSELATYSLKYAIDAPRPNGGTHSFPSGHTSLAFTGAEFIRKEYGAWWGVPAYLAAGFVGWSRVVSHNHYAGDVVAGAALGILSNHDLDSIELPFGSVTLGASLIAAPAADPATLGLTETGDPNLIDAAPQAGALGLKLEWKFW